MNENDALLKQQKKFVIPALRRVSRWWPESKEALSLAKRGKNSYECAKCRQLFKKEDVQRDHISPVVSVSTGFRTWDHYINSLLAYRTAYQILCKPCHEQKTQLENATRRGRKRKRKTK